MKTPKIVFNEKTGMLEQQGFFEDAELENAVEEKRAQNISAALDQAEFVYPEDGVFFPSRGKTAPILLITSAPRLAAASVALNLENKPMTYIELHDWLLAQQLKWGPKNAPKENPIWQNKDYAERNASGLPKHKRRTKIR
jgi:hypothetical protein